MSLREKNRLATRQDLLAAAAALFRERGYDHSSVEAICEQAGVSRATFFNYFPQKELLLTEVASLRLAQLRDFIASQEEWQQPPTLEGIIELFADFCRQNEQLLDLAQSLFGRSLAHPACRQRLAELRAEAIQLITAYLTPLVQARRQDPRLLAEATFAIYLGSMLEWITTAQPPPGVLCDHVVARLRLLLGVPAR